MPDEIAGADVVVVPMRVFGPWLASAAPDLLGAGGDDQVTGAAERLGARVVAVSLGTRGVIVAAGGPSCRRRMPAGADLAGLAAAIANALAGGVPPIRAVDLAFTATRVPAA